VQIISLLRCSSFTKKSHPRTSLDNLHYLSLHTMQPVRSFTLDVDTFFHYLAPPGGQPGSFRDYTRI
jgi:hypothetical protein